MSEWVATWVRRRANGLGQPSQCDITCDTEREALLTVWFGTGISKITKVEKRFYSFQLC